MCLFYLNCTAIFQIQLTAPQPYPNPNPPPRAPNPTSPGTSHIPSCPYEARNMNKTTASYIPAIRAWKGGTGRVCDGLWCAMMDVASWKFLVMGLGGM